MLPKLNIYALILVFCAQVSVFGQDSLSTEVEKQKKWELRGYLKDMGTFNFSGDSALVDNLVHNRLNFKWYPNDRFTFHLDARTRLFSGGLVKTISKYYGPFGGYGAFIDTNNDYFDLSALPINRNNVVLHTMIDRAYVQYTKEKWEIRVGRQRINWGTNIVWNPNDLFNAYSFFDFDYEERPGSDAIRVTHYNNYTSSVEFAAKIANDIDSTVMAMMYRFNKFQYDIQLIGGIANGDATLGIGWAGNIKLVGFKGEMTWFQPYGDRPGDYSAFVASLGLDYSFPNSLYLFGSWLYNSEGSGGFGDQGTFLFNPERLSSKNLMPVKHSAIVSGNFPFHPLVTAGLSVMAFPGDNALFFSPNLGISVVENFDLGLFGQLFLDDDINGNYGSAATLFFLRGKWSF